MTGQQGNSNRELLRQHDEHFISGMIAAPNGTKMIRFDLAFRPTIDEMQVLNLATNGIRYCERVVRASDNSNVVYVQFATGPSGPTENQMISIALMFRFKANDFINVYRERQAAKAASSETETKTAAAISNKNKVTPISFKH